MVRPKTSIERWVEEEIHNVGLWTGRRRLMTLPFADIPVDPFFNANRPEDFDYVAALLNRIRD
jgi:hypothetical protein